MPRPCLQESREGVRVHTQEEKGRTRRFCSQCGETISPNEMFCPTCGAIFDISRNEEPDESEAKHGWVAGMNEDPRTATWITVMALAVWVVIGLAEGLHFIGSTWLAPHGDDILSLNPIMAVTHIAMFQGFIMFSSGMAALASAQFCYIHDDWHMASMTCLLAAVLPLALLITGDIFAIIYTLMGLFVWLRIYLTRPIFK